MFLSYIACNKRPLFFLAMLACKNISSISNDKKKRKHSNTFKTTIIQSKSEFKPVKLRLKTDLVSRPARAEGLINIYNLLIT